MEYEKPVCITMVFACVGIQNQVKCICVLLDALLLNTMGAYDADE
jgi:hypothetical protein